MSKEILLCLLVISLPFVSSYALATGIEVNSVVGQDGRSSTDSLTGNKVAYIRSTDNLTAQISASVDGDSTINDSQVVVDHNGYEEEASCSGQSCTYTRTFSNENGKAELYNIYLKNDAGDYVDSTAFFVVIDDDSPDIDSFSVQQAANTMDVNLSYSVNDPGYSMQGSEFCLGVKTITFYDEEGVVGTINADNEYSCDEVSGKEEATVPADGNYKFCINASDYFGQTTEGSCKTFSVDTQPPDAVSLNVSFYGGAEIEVLSDEPTTVYVRVYFSSANDLDYNSVEADMYEMSEGWVYADGCWSGSDGVYCEWVSQVSINGSFTPQADVNFSDDSQNKNSVHLTGSYAIQYDNSSPAISGLTTNNGELSSGKEILRAYNNISLIVSDSYFEQQEAYIYSDDLGITETIADNCTESDPHQCLWKDVHVQVDDGNYTLCAYAVDDLGNEAEETCLNVTADTLGPSLERIVITPVHDSQYVPSGVNRTVKGDHLEITASLSDTGASVTAKANLSHLFNSSMYGASSGSCQSLGNNSFNCSWSTTNINTDDTGNIPVSFEFYDEAGNPTNTSVYVYVHGIENGTDYYNADVTCSPKNFDRSLFSMTSMRSYCLADLEASEDDVDIVDIQFQQSACKALTDADYAYSFELLNEVNSTEPYIKVTFINKQGANTTAYNCPIYVLPEIPAPKGSEGPGDFDYDSCQGSCPVYYENADTGYVANAYEEINLTLAWSFNNEDIGTISEKYKDKVEGVVDDAWVSSGWIADLEQWISIAESLCQIKELFSSIYEAWNTFQQVWTPCADTNPYCYSQNAVAKAGSDGADNSIKKIWNYVEKFCQFVTCSASPWEYILGDDNGESKSAQDGEPEPEKDYDFFESYLDTTISKGGFDWGNGTQTYEERGEGIFITADAWGNTKSNCILSHLSLCLPGMVDCYNRWRQIQCQYGQCLINTAKAHLDPAICSTQKDFLECKFIFSMFFDAIPFVGWLKGLYQQFVNWLSDPVGIIFSIVEYKCGVYFMNDYYHYWCHVYKLFKEVMEIYSQFESISENFKTMFQPQEDACSTFLSDAEAFLNTTK